MYMKKLATLFCALAALTACSTKQNDAENAAPTKFLINAGIIAGEKVELPAFGESQEITEEVKAIFNAACGSYSMPLGEPVAYCCRAIANGTEYLFTVENNGSPAGQIYVTAAEGKEPEFTQVVR